ncbi:hypothetical protein [Rhodoferax sp.]|uniref:hypothetical protein n=1 Tax=Rhodoferax sp. TaxID=50421 RepID=UPI002742C4E7|nr:hypothetical protein [Rhodoferax sp.]
MTTAKAKSRIFEAVHETASDFHRLGFIDKRNMHKIDALCLEPVPDYDSEKPAGGASAGHCGGLILAALAKSAPTAPDCRTASEIGVVGVVGVVGVAA